MGAARGSAAPRSQLTYDAFAVTAPGLAALAAAELASLGIAGTPDADGVAFRGGFDAVVRANLHLRTASRVLVRVASFRATAFHELERLGRAVPWERFVAPGDAVRFAVTARKSRLYHSDAIAQRLAEAVDHRLGRPGPSVAAPRASADAGEDAADEADGERAQRFVVRAVHDVFTISADSSGALLHRRGHRLAVARAPLRETLAAAMLLGAGYDGGEPLLDPMCGAGTLLIEAALIARRIAPALGRALRCGAWPEAPRNALAAARAAAEEMILRAAPHAIVGADRDAGAIEAARANAERAGVAADLELGVRPLSATPPRRDEGLLITNPPYGKRVGEEGPLRDLYARLGQLVRGPLAGWRVALLSASAPLERQLRLPLEERWRSNNGGIPVRLLVSERVAPAHPDEGARRAIDARSAE